MSRPEGSGAELDALLARPTPAPDVEEIEPDPVTRPARGRLESWLRGGPDRAAAEEVPDGRSGVGGSLGIPASSGPGADAGVARVDVGVDGAGRAVDGSESGVDGAGPAVDGDLRRVAVESIVPNAYQPRRHFDHASLASLADSIAALGVLQPVLVRPVGSGRYELVAGERRWRAAQLAGLRTIPVLVRDLGDQGALEQAVVENLHRQDLNPLEEAAAYQELVDDFGLTQDAVARRVGKSRPAVANTLRLLQLPGAVQRLVVDGRLSAGHARTILSVSGREAQIALAERVITEDLSVRQTEEAARTPTARSGVGSSPASTSASGAPAKSIGALEVQMLLEERLATRVEVQEAGRGGRVVVRYADGDDLSRLVELLLGDAGPRTGPQ